jgi:hypothetical protein
MPLFSQWGVYSLAERDARRDEFRAAHRHRSDRGPDAEVHRSLSGLGQPIRRSVQHEHVVCLECGYRSRVLRGISASLMGLNLRSIASAGSCHLITRSLRRPIRSGVRQWQSRSVLVANRRKPSCRLPKWSQRPHSLRSPASRSFPWAETTRAGPLDRNGRRVPSLLPARRLFLRSSELAFLAV